MEEAVRVVGLAGEAAPAETVRKCNRTPRPKRGVFCLIVSTLTIFTLAFGIITFVTFCAGG
jgi:hypothetical protein